MSKIASGESQPLGFLKNSAKFQNKCLGKMSDEANSNNRTSLYVSHNMSTIQRLCSRVIVLDHGKVVFDGGVEEGIGVYASCFVDVNYKKLDLSTQRMKHLELPIRAKLWEIVLQSDRAVFQMGDSIRFWLKIHAYDAIGVISLRMELFTREGIPVGVSVAKDFSVLEQKGDFGFSITLNCTELVPGEYIVCLVLYEQGRSGGYNDLDAIYPTFPFRIEDYNDFIGINWNYNTWGRIKFDNLIVERTLT